MPAVQEATVYYRAVEFMRVGTQSVAHTHDTVSSLGEAEAQVAAALSTREAGDAYKQAVIQSSSDAELWINHKWYDWVKLDGNGDAVTQELKPFTFQGDHGDKPEPGRVMFWAQWDKKPLAVINDGGKFYGAIILTDEPVDKSRAAINAARDYLTEAEDAKDELAFVLGEVIEGLQEYDRSFAFTDAERTDTLLRRLRNMLNGK